VPSQSLCHFASTDLSNENYGIGGMVIIGGAILEAKLLYFVERMTEKQKRRCMCVSIFLISA
jgi:hypothetical protein